MTQPQSPVIDLHTHIVVPDALGAMRRRRPELAPQVVEVEGAHFFERKGGRRSGPIPPSLLDVDRRLADMDRQGVDVQVLSAPPSNFYYEADPALGAEFAALQNDAMLEVVDSHRERFQLFVTLPLQDVDATCREIERVGSRDAVRGVEIGTHIAGRGLNDRGLDPVWETLAAADLPVWIHPDWVEMGKIARLADWHLRNLIGNPLESTMAMAALIFGGVFERHPTLRVGFVHAGGFAPYQLGRWDHGWSVRPECQAAIDRQPSDYLRSMWFDTLTHHPGALAFLGERVGWDRVALGSDHPYDMASTDPVGGVRALGLPAADEQAVLGGNARSFLRK